MIADRHAKQLRHDAALVIVGLPAPNAAIDLTLAPKYAAMTLEHETE